MPVFCNVNGGLSLLDGDFGGDITLRYDTAERGLPACRLTAYSAGRIEFQALRCCTDLDHALRQNAPVVTAKAFCCVLVKTEAGRRISSLQNPRSGVLRPTKKTARGRLFCCIRVRFY